MRGGRDAEDAARPWAITLLTCSGKLQMAKAYDIAGNRVAVTAYSKAKYTPST